MCWSGSIRHARFGATLPRFAIEMSWSTQYAELIQYCCFLIYAWQIYDKRTPLSYFPFLFPFVNLLQASQTGEEHSFYLLPNIAWTISLLCRLEEYERCFDSAVSLSLGDTIKISYWLWNIWFESWLYNSYICRRLILTSPLPLHQKVENPSTLPSDWERDKLVRGFELLSSWKIWYPFTLGLPFLNVALIVGRRI